MPVQNIDGFHTFWTKSRGFVVAILDTLSTDTDVHPPQLCEYQQRLSMPSLSLRLMATAAVSGGIGCLVTAAAAVIDLNFVDLPEIVEVNEIENTACSIYYCTIKISERDCARLTS